MICNFINEEKYNWTVEQNDSISVSYVGRKESIDNLLQYIKQGNELKISEIKKITNQMTGNFSVVVETNDWLFGLVDRVSGYRLFYRDNQSGCTLSNSPRRLVNKEQDDPPFIQESITEIKMAGYLTGNRTVYKNIFQLCAGEFLLYDKNKYRYTINSYFKFYSASVRNVDNDTLIEELDNITDVIIKRNIEDANGKTIWVPLSGGLDSRLIVCKLKQLGCDNFRTYSYGVAGNFDAIRAREIASTLNIQWDFFPTTAKEARKYFLSEKRKEYWDFADGLSVVPNLHGMFALKSLVDLGKIKPGDVVINGQSGDFIAGQHIPIIKDHKADDKMLLDCILRKHYRLRKEMLGNSEFVELVNTRIKKSLGKYQHVTNYQDFAKSYEYWEWKERQVKRVVNGQCNYNYFGLKWELPLWDLEYLQFWIDLPLHQKVDRRLFIEYLNKMDFYGLFKGNNKFMSRWPLDRVYIQFIGNIISKIFGKNISNLYYKKLDRYSQYQYMYGLIGGREYKHHWRDYKGVYPYLTDIWLNENIKRN
ncbi:hypothetical protein HOL24_08730 [bacterium]|jgi:asparagine synthase (glutamine-hydrolysing)|nr:hypothetical protein [bacterium]